MLKAFLTVEELCIYLGISKSTAYKLSHNNVLPKYCPGGKKILFKTEEVESYVNSHRIASADEIQRSIDEELMYPSSLHYNKRKKVTKSVTLNAKLS